MEKHHRGVKRRRIESENAVDDALRIPGKLHHGLKEVKKAAKKAKVFETQKLVKKLKELRFATSDLDEMQHAYSAIRKKGDKANISEHEAQLDILKAIDHEVFANTAMKTKITKDKLLSPNEQIQESLSLELGEKLLSASPKEGPTAKVHSRLLSSKILATEISSLCEALRELLGHQPKKPRKEGGSDDHLDTSGDAKNPPSQKEGTATDTHIAADSDMDLEEAEDRIIDETGWESGTVDEEERLNDSGVDSEEDEPAIFEFDSDIETNRRTKPLQSAAPAKLPAAQQSNATSTFLPSLSVGFIRGSDESDWSDTEAKAADPGQKKNRRGQRARRAIWEKKYGRNANHKKKELLEAQDKKKNREANNRPGVHPGFQRPANSHIATGSNKWPRDNKPGPSQPAVSHTQASTKSHDKPLHPSWEAKRKLKEQQSVAIRPSEGTKIKFSD
ncbi:hypothetical protein NP233_g6688 [Leucocoprinus birnbaumii]|uniref:Bud22 domain-containing protein n=1 Tax=Leucocoprinus birnbaumii TaxID=56174 RepID=A0AAD5VQN4_9AGAR|nr:hypothetical protein NP233_g6688 [Leucocoprinus birnbaumii]